LSWRYAPLLAKYNAASQITALAVVFIAMTAVWYITVYYLVNHPLLFSNSSRRRRTPMTSAEFLFSLD
jgi:hypothetical protein